jgi:hypothetical protein
MLMELMGLHLPGTAFVNPGTPLREALTVAGTQRVAGLSRLGDQFTPIAHVVDERAIVNGIVGLMATGGSTNHALHLVAIARAAGIRIDWRDLAEISAVVPLLARVYPNGTADVNHFHAAGGLAFMTRELLDAGLLHEDVITVAGRGLRAYTPNPILHDGALTWIDAPAESGDPTVVGTMAKPFSGHGGLMGTEAITVKVGKFEVELRPPPKLSIRWEILHFQHANEVRAACAALAACWRGRGRPSSSFKAHGYNVGAFGGAVLEELLERGAPFGEIASAGTMALGVLALDLVKPEDVDSEAERFPDDSGEPGLGGDGDRA